MPKHGGNPHANGPRSGNADFYEHDDRDNRKDRRSVRRVSFKNTQNQQFKDLKGRLAELAFRTRLEDDDEMGDMGATSSRFGERAGHRRKGSPIPKGKFGNLGRLLPNPFGWYQVKD